MHLSLKSEFFFFLQFLSLYCKTAPFGIVVTELFHIQALDCIASSQPTCYEFVRLLCGAQAVWGGWFRRGFHKKQLRAAEKQHWNWTKTLML